MEPKTNLLHRFRLPISVSSWITFAISLAFYWITADPGVSYWDCPEYVTVASKMEVGHPPGNPVWMLALRVATIPFPPQYHAYIINLWSGAFMALAAFFLCRVIFVLLNATAKPVLPWRNALISSGASLCFALCDSAWYSAVEAEVYAMSAFLTGLSLWIMTVWWYADNKGKQMRWLILLAYITGLSLGVHQLNLLLIPVFSLIVLYRLHPEKIPLSYPILCFICSFALVGLILFVFLPSVIKGAMQAELFGVNVAGWPYHYGMLAFIIIVFLILIVMAIATGKLLFRHPGNRRPGYTLYYAVWSGLFLLLGYSSFGIIMIRAAAAPPMNDGVPDNIFTLGAYIDREQYPSTPLFYGQTPYSMPILEESFVDGSPVYSRYVLKKGNPKYRMMIPDARLYYRSRMVSHSDSMHNEEILKRGKGYLLEDYRFSQVLTPELNMWFPRITSRKVSDREAYDGWAGMNEQNMDYVAVSQAKDSSGNFVPKMDVSGNREDAFSYRPTYMQNLRFFMSYQSYYMYFRYLFWNFVGRQNDYPSQGEVEHGNFITGIPPFDRFLPGTTSQSPAEISTQNKGHNRYFAIPFLFGIFGIFCLLCRKRFDQRILAIITAFFFMTGLAIVIYLNQSPGEPRERDYTFLGSYMAFAIWIAFGIKGFSDLFGKQGRVKAAWITVILISCGIPTLMAVENFDDHDRRGRFETTYYASSLLDFEIPSVIFSYGDNSSFPLWYATEVLDLGKNHTPVDITYLSLPSYVVNLKKQGERGVKTLASSADIAFGRFLLTGIPPAHHSDTLPLSTALRQLYASDATHPVFPSAYVSIPKDRMDSLVIDLRELTKGSSYLSFRHLMLLDILVSQLESDQPKALYFPSYIDYSFYRPLMPALHPTLFGRIYAPWISDSVASDVLSSAAERELMKIQGLNTIGHYTDPLISDYNRRYRGELIMAAEGLLSGGKISEAEKIASAIELKFPYADLSPGSFTVTDSTFYEGKEYIRLMTSLYEATGNENYAMKADTLQAMMAETRSEWLHYYNSLSPQDRKTLSNRSRRLLIK